MTEHLGPLLATVVTLALFSRVWRPTLGFRLAERLLLGALAGYVAAVAARDVLWPGLILPLRQGDAQTLIPLTLGGLLALRFTRVPWLRAWGLPPLGILVGGAAALAAAGALRGTLTPQILAGLHLSFLPAGPVWADFLLTLLSTLATLAVLAYLLRVDPPGRGHSALAALTWLGQALLMLALGGLLATTAGARLTLLIDRIAYLLTLWGQAPRL